MVIVGAWETLIAAAIDATQEDAVEAMINVTTVVKVVQTTPMGTMGTVTLEGAMEASLTSPIESSIRGQASSNHDLNSGVFRPPVAGGHNGFLGRRPTPQAYVAFAPPQQAFQQPPPSSAPSSSYSCHHGTRPP